MIHKLKESGYVGSINDPDSVLQKLLDLGGHNNLHIKCNNPNKIYFILPNKTISCKWIPDDVCREEHAAGRDGNPFSVYIDKNNGISFCAYNYSADVVWNPGMGFIHIPSTSSIEKITAPEADVRNLLDLAKRCGYVYIPKADVWKFKITQKSPCYYKQSIVDMFWSIGVFLGYDDHGNAIIDRGSDSTLCCRAGQCVPYNKYNTKVDTTGQINDKLVNIHLI